MLLNSLLLEHFDRSCGVFAACLQSPPQAVSGDQRLHDLRIHLRQLRSLIRPLTASTALRELDGMLAAVLSKTNALRDTEVLIAELERRQQPELSLDYRRLWRRRYQELALASALELIIQKLIALSQHQWPEAKLQRRLASYCRRQRQLLLKQLKRGSKADRHRIRLAVKRLRYTLEMYGEALPAKPGLVKNLKLCQAVLGDWHDRWVWIELGRHDERLLALADSWRRELQDKHHAATGHLRQLRRSLRKNRLQPGKASKR